MFTEAVYPLEGASFEELLELAKMMIYQNRDVQKVGL